MIRRFGEQARQFSLSVDIVDGDLLNRAWKIIKTHVTEDLGARYFELMKFERLQNRAGDGKGPAVYSLVTVLSNGPKKYTTYLDDHKEPTNHVALAHKIGLPLWVVGVSGEALVREQEFRDLWSRRNDLPAYEPISGINDIKTSVIVPVSCGDQAPGVVDFEFPQHLPYTREAADELSDIATSIANLHAIERANAGQRSNTQEALDRLDSLRREHAKRPSIVCSGLPKLFLAFPRNGDGHVIDAIKSVVFETFKGKLTVFEWTSVKAAGNLLERQEREIKQCSFGICYLSEGAESGYCDNPNVLFEAGMLHALASADAARPRPWLPIREDLTDVPFDFSTMNIVTIPRDNKGRLKRSQFTQELTVRIKGLLDALQS